MRYLWMGLYMLIPIAMVAAAAAALPARGMRFFGYALGLVAYFMMGAQLIFAARLPAVERVFGQDQLLRIHGMAALGAFLLAAAHALVLKWGEPILTPGFGTWALLLYAVTIVLAVLFLSSLVSGRLPLWERLRRRITARSPLGRYHIQLALHRLTLLAVVFMMGHVFFRMGGFRRAPLLAAFLLGWGLLSLGVFLWQRWLRRPYRFTVAAVEKENDAMTTIRLIPAEGRSFSWLPGQFLYIRFRDPAVSSEAHPFSVSSAPGEDLAVTIKSLGDWTEKAGQIQVGSTAFVDGPYGRACPALYRRAPLVLIAGGVGITPMMSIIRDAARRGMDEPILLLWCARDRSELIRCKEWKELSETHGDFHCLPVLSRDKAEGCAAGRLSAGIVREALQTARIDGAEAEVYYCGPAPLRETVHAILQELSIPRRHFHEESFSF